MLENGHIAESTWDHLVTLGIPPDTDADGNSKYLKLGERYCRESDA